MPSSSPVLLESWELTFFTGADSSELQLSSTAGSYASNNLLHDQQLPGCAGVNKMASTGSYIWRFSHEE